MVGVADGERGAAGRPAGCEAGGSVLHDETARGIEPEPASAFAEGVRSRLAALNVVDRDDLFGMAQTGAREARRQECPGARGDDGDSLRRNVAEGPGRAGEHLDPLLRGVDLQLLDAREGNGHPVGGHDVPDDVCGRPAGDAAHPRDIDVVLGRPYPPRRLRDGVRVDQGAVHVEEHRVEVATDQGAQVEPSGGRIHGVHSPDTQGPGVTGSLRSSAGRSQRAVIAAAS
jgi:hypothetical protein